MTQHFPLIGLERECCLSEYPSLPPSGQISSSRVAIEPVEGTVPTLSRSTMKKGHSVTDILKKEPHSPHRGPPTGSTLQSFSQAVPQMICPKPALNVHTPGPNADHPAYIPRSGPSAHNDDLRRERRQSSSGTLRGLSPFGHSSNIPLSPAIYPGYPMPLQIYPTSQYYLPCPPLALHRMSPHSNLLYSHKPVQNRAVPLSLQPAQPYPYLLRLSSSGEYNVLIGSSESHRKPPTSYLSDVNPLLSSDLKGFDVSMAAAHSNLHQHADGLAKATQLHAPSITTSLSGLSALDQPRDASPLQGMSASPGALPSKPTSAQLGSQPASVEMTDLQTSGHSGVISYRTLSYPLMRQNGKIRYECNICRKIFGQLSNLKVQKCPSELIRTIRSRDGFLSNREQL